MNQATLLKIAKTGFGIATLLFVLHKLFFTEQAIQERAAKAQVQPTLPAYAPSYNYYTSDPRAEVKGSTREYRVAGVTSDWVSLVSNDTTGTFSMITGETFRGQLGFNPKTLKGVWVGEHPNKGDIQKAGVTLAKNSYGGYDILFTYDNGALPCLGELTPNW